jgi:hypothetical protein
VGQPKDLLRETSPKEQTYPRDVFTSGTLFASHKMPLRRYLSKTVIFINKVKDNSAFALGFHHGSDTAG